MIRRRPSWSGCEKPSGIEKIENMDKSIDRLVVERNGIMATGKRHEYDVVVSDKHKDPSTTWVRETLVHQMDAEGCRDEPCVTLAAKE